MVQVHGGDIYNHEVEIDYSANINPFGMPKSVELAAIDGVRKSIHYPEISCTRLRAAIAKKEGVKKEQIICSNGAAEVIYQLIYAYRPKRALLFYPSFSEYEQALRAGGCEIQTHMLRKEHEYKVTETIFTKLEPSLDILFLCNPNNPTGVTIPKDLLSRMIEECFKKEILLVIDECFQDFLEENEQDSRVGFIEKYPNLFILKAFTKMYGMAGLRLGYGLTSNRTIIENMEQSTQPWNVSIPAQLAGIAACSEEGFVKESREYVAKQRMFLQKELKRLGLHVYPSKANYIFFEGPRGLYEECLKHKILIRSCCNYPGLEDKHYRIAVKLEEDNKKLIQFLEKILLP